MSNRDDKLNKINDIVNDDLMAYITPTEQQTDKDNINATENKKDANKGIKKDNKGVSDAVIKGLAKGVDIALNGYKYKNGEDKNDNYTITFKIDADIEDYLKQIEIITFIENIKKGNPQSINKTDYVNELIRADFKKMLGLKQDATNEDIQNKWLEYKKANNLK